MVVMIVSVVIMVGLPTGALRGPRLGAFNGGCAHEWIRAEHNTAADRFAGLRMLCQRRILDGLEDLVTPHGFSGARQSFVNVGDHSRSEEGWSARIPMFGALHVSNGHWGKLAVSVPRVYHDTWC